MFHQDISQPLSISRTSLKPSNTEAIPTGYSNVTLACTGMNISPTWNSLIMDFCGKEPEPEIIQTGGCTARNKFY